MERSGDLTVEAAHSAREAMQRMASSHYDVIISDYQMPDIDGLQYLRMVREKDPDIPFILFTGRGREEVVIEACNAGVTSYVQKGIDIDAQFTELEHRVKQAAARLAAEEELRTKKLQANMAMDLARIASWEYDPWKGLYKFDDIFYDLYGTDARQEGGYLLSPERYLQGFVHPDDHEYVSQMILKGFNGNSPEGQLQIRHRMVRRDGEIRAMLVRAEMMIDANGNLLKIIGVSQDITER